MQRDVYQPPVQLSIIPPVIKNLLIINGLLFLALNLETLWVPLMQWFALWPIDAPAANLPGFWPWQLVTYAFLHSTAGIWHIFFNMFALWMFGMQIENTWGSRRFGVYYFICVIGAGLIQLLVVHLEGGSYPTVGASGGVYGVLLAFALMFPNQPIYLYFLVPIKAKWLVVGLAVLDLYAGATGAPSGVAHFAHLGGMLFGLAIILYWRGKLPLKPRQRMWW